MSHTPGPWKYEIKKEGLKKWGIQLHLVQTPNGETLAELYTGHAEMENKWDELASNARLIAAAPELLEALEDIVHDADDNRYFDEHGLPTTSFHSINKARAIIAKAK